MKFRKRIEHIGISLLLAMTTVAIWGQEQPNVPNTDSRVIIFQIGQEDRSDREFQRMGWKGQKEYTCHIGVDCKDEKFPAELLVPKSDYPDYGVECVTIYFEVKKAGNAILRLARGGDETTVVLIDRERKYIVTSAMLGSGEGFRVGTYELAIGSINIGWHSIEFTVLIDGKANGAYQWDAITLFAQ